ncbi:ferritin-like domain-containing protein [Bryobacter aggregatus]|uniref:ferritin-like domain-containing protein n=1 Tax=Bryobacter aggregatus TaxID=360054 RepID=UPI00068AC624|nr:PA2169 family four-helix-bundle protein [Bryobacter aggregatus]
MTTQTFNQDVDTAIINNLIETLKDGENGFKAAVADVTDRNLKSTFEKYASQRHSFVAQLQQTVRREGETPETSGSITAAAHRGWMSVKSAVTGKNDHAILEECERGEDAAVKAYREATASGKLGSAAPLVAQQAYEIKAAHDAIRALRDGYKS